MVQTAITNDKFAPRNQTLNFNKIILIKVPDKNIKMSTSLQRFTEAHAKSYQTALAEIQSGKKQSHWMWYIFPQLENLGTSETAKFYGIKDSTEAAAFLADKELGKNLIEISTALLQLEPNDPHAILGSPDDMKLKSCMTLFASIQNSNPVFEKVLQKFYNGQKDEKTLSFLQAK